MKKKNNSITVLILLVVFTLIPLSASGKDERYEISIDNATYKGPADAPITIIEFLDFQ